MNIRLLFVEYSCISMDSFRNFDFVEDRRYVHSDFHDNDIEDLKISFTQSLRGIFGSLGFTNLLTTREFNF